MDDLLEAALATVPYPHPATAALPTRRAPSPFATPPPMLLRQNKSKSRNRRGPNRSRKEWMDRIVESCRRRKWCNSCQLAQDLQCNISTASILMKVSDERLILVAKVGWRNGSRDGLRHLLGLKGEPIPEGYVLVENEEGEEELQGQQADDLVNYLMSQKKWATTTDIIRHFKLYFHVAKKIMMAIKDERLVLTRKTLKSGAVLFLLGLREWKVHDGYKIYNGEEEEEDQHEEEAAGREPPPTRSRKELIDLIVETCPLHKWRNCRQLAQDLQCSVDRASILMKVPDERLILVEKVGWRRGIRDELRYLIGLKGELIPEGYVIVKNKEGQLADDLVNYVTSQMQWATTTDIVRHFNVDSYVAKQIMMVAIKDERLVLTRKRQESGTVYSLLGLRGWEVRDGYEICNDEEEEEEEDEEEKEEEEDAAAEVMEEPPRKRLKVETPIPLEMDREKALRILQTVQASAEAARDSATAALHAAHAIRDALKRMLGHD